MQKSEPDKINVIASFASFTTTRQKRRITPHRFLTRQGHTHVVAQIRRTYTERVGDTRHVHFVVQTREGRFFDIVYDSKEMAWYMVLEIEDDLLSG
ncbi:MAG: hypothetical protein HLUCCA01_03775 [Bacteroidetes bacterium HLUCCA01]|nr:MAG: hypothetical protein HLUCCA01_03775 [Bacteroidetes bacterium HLUCCA01]